MTAENVFTISKAEETKEVHGLPVKRVTLIPKNFRSTGLFRLDLYKDGSLAAQIDDELGGRTRVDLGDLALLKQLIKRLEDTQ